MVDIIKLREEYIKKHSLNKDKNDQLIKISQQESEPNFEYLIQKISQRLNSTISIDDILIEEFYIKLKKISSTHNNKLLEWFDDKYSDDLKLLIETNSKYDEFVMSYEKNCFLSIGLD